MKTIKYLFVGALIVFFSAPIMAQDWKTDLEPIAKAIEANPGNPKAVDSQVKEYLKLYKKDADAIAALGHAFLNEKDSVEAKKYALMAISKDKNDAAGYVLMGDIESVNDNGGAAASWYKQATMMDPNDEQGYIKYAAVYSKRSPELSVEMLEALRKINPDYPVDAESGHLFYRSNKFSEAVEHYAKVDKSKLDENKLTEYAFAAYLLGDSKTSLDVTEYGVKQFPRSASLNRLNFYNYTDLKDYDNALKYADALFNNSDSAKFSARDYQYYGYAYMGAEDYDKAIDMFDKALEMNPEMNDVRKQLSDAYIAKQDYTKGLALYDEYLQNVEKPSVSDLDGLAKLYADQASNSTGDEQIQALKNADRIYGQLGEEYPNNLMYASRMRARLNSQLDPETTQGLAKPYYEKYAELLLSESPDTPNLLIEPYSYLGYYYFQKGDHSNANVYWKKILEIDPSNETARQALSAGGGSAPASSSSEEATEGTQEGGE